MKKVNMHYSYAPIGVTDGGRGVVLSNGTEEMVLDDVGTVIYCTGYSENLDMLHGSLRPAVVGPYFAECNIPSGWRMPANPLSKEFGDVPIGRILDFLVPDGKCSPRTHPGHLSIAEDPLLLSSRSSVRSVCNPSRYISWSAHIESEYDVSQRKDRLPIGRSGHHCVVIACPNDWRSPSSFGERDEAIQFGTFDGNNEGSDVPRLSG